LREGEREAERESQRAAGFERARVAGISQGSTTIITLTGLWSLHVAMPT